MNKIMSLLICMLLLFSCAAAEQEVPLPNSRYVICVPDWMEYSAPEEGDSGVDAYISLSLEIDYFSYPKAEMVRLGMPETLREAAEDRAAKGAEAELREVNGIEMLCFRTTDDADGAPCIGYVFEDGDWMIEVDFWYATQEAAELTATIISSIRPDPEL